MTRSRCALAPRIGNLRKQGPLLARRALHCVPSERVQERSPSSVRGLIETISRMQPCGVFIPGRSGWELTPHSDCATIITRSGGSPLCTHGSPRAGSPHAASDRLNIYVSQTRTLQISWRRGKLNSGLTHSNASQTITTAHVTETKLSSREG